MNVPVLTKLQSNLNEVKKQIKLTNTSTKPFREISTPQWLDYKYDDDDTDEFSQLYKVGNASLELIEFIEQWINSGPEPTWRNFFKVLEYSSSELIQLAYQIKDLFHGEELAIIILIIIHCSMVLIIIIIATEAVDDAAKLKADLVHLWGSSKHAKEMVKELGSSVALCESIIQKM